MNLSQAYGEGATLAYLLTYIFFVNVNLEVSSVLSSKNYVVFVKCWLGLVEVEPFCQDPRCRLK